jgi:prepilin-type N-terminal cleavage/methylation domain-containing protein
MTLNRTRSSKSRKGGFTLIEVALAIVVVALGLLAVFSLLSSGLDAARKAIAETQASIFANSVFNGLRSRSLSIAETSPNPQNWSDFWTAMTSSSTGFVTVAAPATWSPQTIKIIARVPGAVDDTNNTIVFKDSLLHASPSPPTNIVNNSLRYRLNISLPTDLPGPPGVGPASAYWYSSPGVPWYERRAMATLYVWDGAMGATSSNNAMIFYSEFSNPGDL